MTALTISLLNLLAIKNISIDGINKNRDIIQQIENKVDWQGTLKDLWAISWLLLSNHNQNEISFIHEITIYFYKKLKYTLNSCKSDEIPIMISKLFHFFSSLDCLALPYPYEKEIIDFLLSLDYENSRNFVDKNQCTDFDYAYILYNYTFLTHYRHNDIISSIRNIAYQRANEWNRDLNFFKNFTTPYIHNYLISTAVFQKICRSSFMGKYLPDNYNRPSLYRVNC